MPYIVPGASFPVVTIRDSVRLHVSLLTEHLNVSSLACVIGGSLGGMQALEWAFYGTPLVRSIVLLACCAAQTAWQIAFGHAQRQAIYNDPKWKGGEYEAHDPPVAGLSLARQIAMMTYRTHGVTKKYIYIRTVHEKITCGCIESDHALLSS
jgi:homoserine O-acetyltransferase